MLEFVGINEAISGFQKQIGAHDKELWEEHVEEKELDIQGLGTNSVLLRTGRLKTELIDIDLVRGSTFTKAKREHSLTVVARKGLIRVILFPLYFTWWKQQLSKWMLLCLIVLYILQVLSVIVYSLYSPMDGQQPIYFTEVFTPVLLSLVLGVVYAMVVCTTVAKSRSLRRRLTRRSRDIKCKNGGKQTASEEPSNSYINKKRGMHRSQSLPCTADSFYQMRHARRMLSRRFPRPEIVVEDSVTGRRESLVEGMDEASLEDGLGVVTHDDSSKINYVGGVVGDETSGNTGEDFAVLNKPLGCTDIVGEMLQPNNRLPKRQDAVAITASSTTASVEEMKDASSITVEECAARETVAKKKLGTEEVNAKMSNLSLLAHKLLVGNLSDDVSDNPQHASDSEGTLEETEAQRRLEQRLRGRNGVRKGRRKCRDYGSSNDSDVDVLPPVRQVKSLMDDPRFRGLSRSGDSDLDDPSWGGSAEEVSSSVSSSESSESDISDSDKEANGGEEESLHYEDPFKLFPTAVTSTPSACTNTEKICVRMFEGNECKKADMSVLEISCFINAKVHNMHNSCDYIFIGAVCAFILASIPISYRSHGISFLDNGPSWLTYSCLLKAVGTMRLNAVPYIIVIFCSIQRFALSFMFFFLLSVGEKTYKQRCLFAKYFSHLTSTRRARKSCLPHFRLNKVSNIKAWLSLRSFLKKRGPQRSIDVIVSSAFMMTLCLVSVLCVEMLQRDFKFLSHLFNWDIIAWTFCMCPFLLRFMTLGSKINKKFRNTSVLLTEQINLYLHMEKRPHKKEDLILANNVLKLASKLLKEIETPFKIAGMTMNPVLYNITRVVILSAFSGVLTELLGFKLKLWKIKAS